MEEFYYEETNPKNVIVKCLIIIFIIGVFIGGFLYYKKEHTIKLKTITINIGEPLSKNVLDYLSNGTKFSDEYKLYLNDVDTSKVGKYTYKVKYNKHTKKGIIKVVDKIKPEVVANNLTIGVDEDIDINDLIISCKDDSLPCRVELVNDKEIEQFNIVGTHDIRIKVFDNEDNFTETSVIVTVSETETLSSLQTDDLNYYTNSINDGSIEHTLFHELDKAINEETLEYEGLIQEISALDFSEYVNEEKKIYDTKLITAYNKYGYVIGIQVLVTFTDGNKEFLTK